jgi:uncharacterized protein YfdQ (DUF2303 family)
VTTEGFVTAIAELADGAATSEVLEPGKIYAFRTPHGGVQQIDLTDDHYLASPRRKRGVTTVRDTASFLAYWHKHSDAASEVYADRSKLAVTGVLNAHLGRDAGDEPDDTARFGDHRIVLQLKYSDSFYAWLNRSGQPFSQVQFAEFIEDHRADIRSPAAAELLELAQTFQATTKASFKSSNILKSGQRQLEYTEQIDASAGRNGKLTIPDAFELGLAVFDGDTQATPVTARLRYRIQSSGLQMIFIVDQVNEVVNAAFEGAIAELQGPTGTEQPGDPVLPPGVGVPILRGTPA